MSKILNTQSNFSVNFIVKGITSILIGAYILAGTYAINYLLDISLVDDSIIGKISPQNSQILIFLVVLLVLIASTFTIYFKGKKTVEKLNESLWNENSKAASKKYIIGFSIISLILITLFSLDFFNYITPIFLILYGVLLFILKNNERKNFLIIAGICILLAGYCFVIPSYWYSSLSILGIAHITYGVAVNQEKN